MRNNYLWFNYISFPLNIKKKTLVDVIGCNRSRIQWEHIKTKKTLNMPSWGTRKVIFEKVPWFGGWAKPPKNTFIQRHKQKKNLLSMILVG